eukprot:5711081-Karenia_brevis.AAC.2
MVYLRWSFCTQASQTGAPEDTELRRKSPQTAPETSRGLQEVPGGLHADPGGSMGFQGALRDSRKLQRVSGNSQIAPERARGPIGTQTAPGLEDFDMERTKVRGFGSGAR